MPKRLTFEYVKEFINKENKLISTSYINNNQLLQIKCLKCNKVYEQIFSSYNRGCRCYSCSMSENGKKSAFIKYNKTLFLKDITKICIQCNKQYNPNRYEQKLCDKQCAFDYTQTEEYKSNGKTNGKKGGIISAEKQQRRSKNEITFANLCIDYFGIDDIQCNERIFMDKNGNKWDADCYIKSLKIACLWNGIWHYKKVNKKHNLEQVQLRDKWKLEMILNHGSTYYIIVDMGKADEKFVQGQFNLFIHKLNFKDTLAIIHLDLLQKKTENDLKDYKSNDLEHVKG